MNWCNTYNFNFCASIFKNRQQKINIIHWMDSALCWYNQACSMIIFVELVWCMYTVHTIGTVWRIMWLTSFVITSTCSTDSRLRWWLEWTRSPPSFAKQPTKKWLTPQSAQSVRTSPSTRSVARWPTRHAISNRKMRYWGRRLQSSDRRSHRWKQRKSNSQGITLADSRLENSLHEQNNFNSISFTKWFVICATPLVKYQTVWFWFSEYGRIWFACTYIIAQWNIHDV